MSKRYENARWVMTWIAYVVIVAALAVTLVVTGP